MTRRVRRALALVLAVIVLAGCRSDDGDHGASAHATVDSTSTTTPRDDVLDVLVTNDDGFDAPGLDAVVEALRKERGVVVTVVAPATNQSGAGDKTTPGELAVAHVKTASGYDATSVAGFPADAVNVALDRLGLKPDLVVSGTNFGQNIGPLTQVSGTVGAAKTAARHGVPAVAASTGFAANPDYAASAAEVVEWLREHRADLLAHDRPPFVESLNTPTCPNGDRGVVQVKLATDFGQRDATAVDCTSTKPEGQLRDDVDAFLNGYTSLTAVPF